MTLMVLFLLFLIAMAIVGGCLAFLLISLGEKYHIEMTEDKDDEK